MSEKGFVLTAIEGSPGQVTLAVYEHHDIGKPGIIIRKELTLFEMERLHTVITKALWWHARKAEVPA
jgi:hypothetical protein